MKESKNKFSGIKQNTKVNESFWSIFIESFKLMKNKLIFAIIFSDVFFLLFFGFIFEFIKANVAFELEKIISIIGLNSITIAPGIFEYGTLMQSLKSLPGFSASYNIIFQNIVLLIVLMYILWVCIESVSYYFSLKVSGTSVYFNDYLKKFSIKSIPYFVFFLVFLLFTVRTAISITLKSSIEDANYIYTIFYVVTLILIILMSISYADLSLKFKDVLFKFKKMIKYYIVLTIGFIAVHYILVVSEYVNYTFMVVIGFLVLMPYLAYMRIVNVKGVYE